MSSSHGSRMVAWAQRERDKRAASFGEQGSNSEMNANYVRIRPRVAGVTQLPQWLDVASKQRKVTEEVLQSSASGDFFALRDRNSVTEAWRRVFVVRDDDHFVLFSEEGKVIDEGEDGVPNGRQSVAKLVEEFSPDGFFYGPPFSPSSSPGHHLRNRIVVNATDTVVVRASSPVQPRRHESDEPAVTSARSHHVGEEAASSSTDDVEVDSSKAGPELRVDSGHSEPDGEPERSSSPFEPAQVETSNSDDLNTGEAAIPVDQNDSDEEVPENVGAPTLRCAVSVGARVTIKRRSVDGKATSGMVASQGVLTLIIAMDDGTWATEFVSDLGTIIVLEAETDEEQTGVVGFAYDHSNKQVTGMLLGSSDEGALGGSMHAYRAHVAKPPEESTSRVRGREGNRAGNQSFALGDHVRQLGDPTRSPTFAAVVRVLYSRRGSTQSRRMLVLTELDDNLRLMCRESNPLLFFPGSWANWARLEEESTLDIDDIRRVDEEYLKAGKKNLVGMASLPAAVKFSGANQTPTQLQEGRKVPKPKRGTQHKRNRAAIFPGACSDHPCIPRHCNTHRHSLSPVLESGHASSDTSSTVDLTQGQGLRGNLRMRIPLFPAVDGERAAQRQQERSQPDEVDSFASMMDELLGNSNVLPSGNGASTPSSMHNSIPSTPIRRSLDYPPASRSMLPPPTPALPPHTAASSREPTYPERTVSPQIPIVPLRQSSSTMHVESSTPMRRPHEANSMGLNSASAVSTPCFPPESGFGSTSNYASQVTSAPAAPNGLGSTGMVYGSMLQHDLQSALIRAQLARVTQEREESERHARDARMREVQMRAYYGFPF